MSTSSIFTDAGANAPAPAPASSVTSPPPSSPPPSPLPPAPERRAAPAPVLTPFDRLHEFPPLPHRLDTSSIFTDAGANASAPAPASSVTPPPPPSPPPSPLPPAPERSAAPVASAVPLRCPFNSSSPPFPLLRLPSTVAVMTRDGSGGDPHARILGPRAIVGRLSGEHGEIGMDVLNVLSDLLVDGEARRLLTWMVMRRMRMVTASACEQSKLWRRPALSQCHVTLTLLQPCSKCERRGVCAHISHDAMPCCRSTVARAAPGNAAACSIIEVVACIPASTPMWPALKMNV